MQTLGLASEQKPTDGMFKRLFWPTIENQYDVDLVGQQGFWVCTIVAAVTTIALIAMGQLLIGTLIGLTYFLAGLGVRERNPVAAVLIFLCYALDKLASLVVAMHGGVGGNPFVGLVGLMLLFANVRAVFLTRAWSATAAARAEAGELPERTMDSFTDKLSNAMPAVVWPKAQWLFYPLGILLLLLEMIGVVAAALPRHPAAAAETPAATIEARPSQ